MKLIVFINILLSSLFVFSATAERSGSFLLSTPRYAFKLSELKKRPASSGFVSRYQLVKKHNLYTLVDSWGEPSQTFRPTAFLVQKDSLYTKNTSLYLQALMKHKQKLMAIYNLNNDSYNKLAVMSYGIFGVESKFGTNWMYNLKERNQSLVNFVKQIYYGDEIKYINSRGPTQIKDIPDAIEKHYPKIKPNTLRNPTHAAIATVGFLAETLMVLKTLKDQNPKKMGYITENNIYDYIPYVYSGRMSRLFRSPQTSDGATVTDNLYIKEMKQHIRWLYLMELPATKK